MKQTETARRLGLTPERATRMFLAMLAAALLVVVLFSMESGPAASVGQGEKGSTLLIEQTASNRPAAASNGNSTTPSNGNGSGKGNPGNACNNPVPKIKNPNCRPASPG